MKQATDFNPFILNPWHDAEGFSEEGVQRALDSQSFTSQPYSSDFSIHKLNWGAKRHEARVAYLLAHDFSDPISLQFNPEDGYSNSIDDGHHRLAAAFFRKDETVMVELGGWLSASVRAFGIIIPSYQQIGENELSSTNEDDDSALLALR